MFTKESFKKSQVMYALYGIIFGLCFPVIAYFLLDKPVILFYIICTAPLFLGVFASLAGRKQDNTSLDVDTKSKEIKMTQLLLEEISSFPLKNPNPIFEYSLLGQLTPKNQVAREFVFTCSSEQIERVVEFSLDVFKSHQRRSRVLQLGEKDFQVDAIFTNKKVNLYLSDITELLVTRKESDTKEQYNKAMIDAMPGFVSWVDRELNYLGVNDHMCNFFHKSKEDFIGKKIGKLTGDNTSIIAILTDQLFNSEKDFEQTEFSFNFEGEDYWSYITFKKYNNNQNAVLVSTDITKLKNAEFKIREEQARSESNAKLAAFGEMAAGIAHEINNPLAILNGIGYRLKKLKEKNALTDEKFFDLNEKLFYGVERITKIIDGMKNLAREGGSDAFELVSFKNILDDSLVLLSNKCRNNNIDLQLPVFDEEYELECQRVQISQTVVILINNSIDAIVEQENKWIRVELKNTADALRISIIDSGNGISQDIAKKIFEPFFTTKEVGKGTGLGLSLANKIIESHRGQFSIDSTCANTKFDIVLPKYAIKSDA